MWLWFRFMMFNATFNNISAISWQSVLLVEEFGENHRHVASHLQTISHNVVSGTPRHEPVFELTTLVVICTDCTCSSNYHMWSRSRRPLCGYNNNNKQIHIALNNHVNAISHRCHLFRFFRKSIAYLATEITW